MPPRSRWLRHAPSIGAVMSLLSEAKKADRARAMERRAVAHAANPGAARQAAGHLLEAIAGLRGVSVVSSYLPIRDELDPRPAMLALIGLGYRICVPVIEGKGLPLRFREWTPQAKIVQGTWNIDVPEAGDWLTPQALIVPLVAFDRFGHRLGYGGGFYDRTLAVLREKGPAHAIGFAYSAQEVERLPIEETDARLHAVATEAGLIWPA